MNIVKAGRKKNWMVIIAGKRFLMGGQDEITKEEALREARMIWQFAEAE